MCGCLCAPPTGDLACNPGMWPDWESNFGSQASGQSTEPHQPGLILFFNSKIFPIHRMNFCWFIWHSSHSSQILPFSVFQLSSLATAPFNLLIDFNVLTLKIVINTLKCLKNDVSCQILWVHYLLQIHDHLEHWRREPVWMADRTTEPLNCWGLATKSLSV